MGSYLKRCNVVFCMVVLWLFCFGVNITHANELKAYMSISPIADKIIVDFVKNNTGITIEFVHLTFEELEAKLKAQGDAFDADMIIGCGISTVGVAKQNGWLFPYVSKTWTGSDSKYFNSAGYYNLGNSSFVIIGNKNRLAEKGLTLPKSLKSLLDPKWKGEIIMPNPVTAGVGHMIRYSVLSLYGEQEGWEYFEKLNKNINIYTRNGNGPTDMVGRGEALIALSSDEQIKKRLTDGYPISWVVPEEGTGYQGNYSFIFSKTKKSDLCKKVFDLFGTQEFNNLMGSFGYITPRPSINTLYGNNVPKYIAVDMEKANADKAKNNEIWKQKFK